MLNNIKIIFLILIFIVIYKNRCFKKKIENFDDLSDDDNQGSHVIRSVKKKYEEYKNMIALLTECSKEIQSDPLVPA